MMKFFRKHRKAVSPVIAVMLLVAVAVAAVGAYFIWFRSFQTQTQKSVQETSSGALGQGLQVVSMTDDSSTYYVVLKNTLGTGAIQVNSARISPATTSGTVSTLLGSGGAGSYNASFATQNLIIPAGQSITLTLNYGTTVTKLTGTTRTFTFQGDTGAIAVQTYTDS